MIDLQEGFIGFISLSLYLVYEVRREILSQHLMNVEKIQYLIIHAGKGLVEIMFGS